MGDCTDGYYDSNGICTACKSTCLTCTNATTCASCSNRILNTTTLQCDLCPNGQFYSDTFVQCLDCNGSCNGQCAYQMKCFDCSSYASQGLTMFSLSQMKCASSCSSTEVYINDPQLRGFSLCRKLIYYVNPESTEIVELGTLKYPYK